MLTVGDKLPSLKLPVQQGTSALPAGETIDLGQTNGKWKVLFYWPKDFTFVCPTEIVGYGELKADFEDRDADPDRRFDRHRACPLRVAPLGRAAGRRGLPVDRGQQEGTGRGARHPRPRRGRGIPRDLHHRSGQCHPACDGQRPQRRPQPGRGAARARRASDGRAVPVQLDAGRRGTEAAGRLSFLEYPPRPCGEDWPACPRRPFWRGGLWFPRPAPFSLQFRRIPCRSSNSPKALPDYAKDIRLNLGSILSDQLMGEERKLALSALLRARVGLQAAGGSGGSGGRRQALRSGR